MGWAENLMTFQLLWKTQQLVDDDRDGLTRFNLFSTCQGLLVENYAQNCGKLCVKVCGNAPKIGGKATFDVAKMRHHATSV